MTASLAAGLRAPMTVVCSACAAQVPPHPPCVPFELRDVGRVLSSVMGLAGFYGFGLGLCGAGISSALTIPLGCALSIEDIYGLHAPPAGSSPPGQGAAAGGAALADADSAAGNFMSLFGPGGRFSLSSANLGGGAAGPASSSSSAAAAATPWTPAVWWQRRIRPIGMVLFLGLSIIPSLLRWPTIAIITTAQVVNGLLLPCVAAMLFISLNHARCATLVMMMPAGRPEAVPLLTREEEHPLPAPVCLPTRAALPLTCLGCGIG